VKYHILPFLDTPDPWYKQEVINELNYKFRFSPVFINLRELVVLFAKDKQGYLIYSDFFYRAIHYESWWGEDSADINKALFQYISPLYYPNYDLITC
jgi:hypothetical protein